MDLKTRLCTITPSIGPIKSREEDGKVKLVGPLLKHYLSYTGKLSLVKGDIFFPIQSYFKEKLEIILYVQGTTHRSKTNFHCRFSSNKRPLSLEILFESFEMRYHMPLKRFYNEIVLFLYHAMTIVRGNDSSGSDPGKKSYD